MGKIRKCGNCGKEMEFLGEEQIQLGQTGLLQPGHLGSSRSCFLPHLQQITWGIRSSPSPRSVLPAEKPL